jgi:dolichol-phosphate mannosyltransferase
MWSRHPATGYFDHPPMVAWLVRAGTAFLPGELGVRILFVACGALAVVFAGLLARELSDDPRAPPVAAALAATSPILVLTGGLALPDAPVEAAYAAATWLVARARGRGWITAGVAVGLALLSKYTAALLAPALLLLVVLDRELRR